MESFAEQASAALARTELLEALAAVEHERWSRWQRYLHSNCVPGGDGSLTIPTDLVARWTAQMTMSYAELSEVEKESDREQVCIALEGIRAADVGRWVVLQGELSCLEVRAAEVSSQSRCQRKLALV